MASGADDNEYLDGFTPVTREDVSDLHSLPKRFDMFAAEIRSSFELLGNRILPFIAKVESTLVDISERVSTIERWKNQADDRLAALERISKPRPRARRK